MSPEQLKVATALQQRVEDLEIYLERWEGAESAASIDDICTRCLLAEIPPSAFTVFKRACVEDLQRKLDAKSAEFKAL